MDMTSPKTFTLITPLKADDGSTILELTLEEPTYAEQIKLAENTKKFGEQRAFLTLLSDQCKQPASTLMKLRARDFKAISEYLEGFFSDGPEKSGT